MSTGRSGYIDQWRGISVLAVIVHHAILFRLLPSVHVSGTDLPARIIAKVLELANIVASHIGPLGVSIFFVISGYLITRLMLKEHEQTGSVSLKAFYVRRITRIMPAMVCYVLAVTALSSLGLTHMAPIDTLKGVSYLCNTSFVQCADQLAPLWSLGVEEQFYLFWPILLIISGRFRVPLTVFIMVTAAACSVVPQFLIRDWLNNGLAFFCLSSGVLFALSPRFRAAFAVLRRVPTWALIIPLLLIFVGFRVTHGEFWRAALIVVQPPLIVAAVLGRDGNVFGPRLSEVVRRVGLVSYSLYLWHFIAVWPPQYYLSQTFNVLSVLAIPFAWVSYRYIEQPFIAIGHRLSKSILAARQASQGANSDVRATMS